MEIIRYASFSEKTIENAVSNKSPRPDILECHPSPFCQLTCSYCHSKWIGVNEKSVHLNNNQNWRTNLIAIDQFKKLFEEFKQLGGQYIVISGGEEPALYPDFLKLLKVCNEMDFRPHVYTNGVADVIANNIYEILQRTSSIRISIHSSAGFNNIMRIIGYLRKIHISDDTLLKKVHIAMYEDIFELGEKKAVRVISELSKIPINIEIKNILGGLANNETVCRYHMDKMYELFVKYGTGKIIVKNAGSGKTDKCFSIYRSVIVDPYGGVHTCCMRAHLSNDDFGHLGNIKHHTLQEILDDYNPLRINKYIDNCRMCSDRDYEFNKLIKEYLEARTLCM